MGGHWDHLGVSSEGEIYNGANDNASGTAVTMEIARVMKLSGAQPKRTVVFGLWAAEESGAPWIQALLRPPDASHSADGDQIQYGYGGPRNGQGERK